MKYRVLIHDQFDYLFFLLCYTVWPYKIYQYWSALVYWFIFIIHILTIFQEKNGHINSVRKLLNLKSDYFLYYACVCVCVCVCIMASAAQLYQTLCNPIDCSLPDSSVNGIFWARIMEWVAISFSRRSSQLKAK